MVFRFSQYCAFFFLLANVAQSQVAGISPLISSSSMHVLIGGRSMALGDSWSGRGRTPAAWSSNPAALAGSIGAGIEYGLRTGTSIPSSPLYNGKSWWASSSTYYSGGGWSSTPIGIFALHYIRLDRGTIPITLDTTDALAASSDETIALSYATDYLAPLSIGATIKYFREAIALNHPQLPKPQPSFYADLGIIFSAESPLNIGSGGDSIHGGIALQNLGSDYIYADWIQPQRVAQWLRAGIAYDAGFFIKETLPRIRISITGEYRRLLNSADRQIYRSDFWGAGIEATAYDFLSFRLGVLASPENIAPEYPANPSVHYGCGIHLPLRKAGIDIPLKLELDYGIIRVTHGTGHPTPAPEFHHGLDLRMEFIGSLSPE